MSEIMTLQNNDIPTRIINNSELKGLINAKLDMTIGQPKDYDEL
jgi:hypothetical protein